jgi:hypothetical protein
MTTPLEMTLTADKVELGDGTSAQVVLKVRNLGSQSASVVVACPLGNTYGKEASRSWTSPTVTGVTSNDTSGTGAINDTLTLAAGATVTYYMTCTLNSLGSYTHALTTLKATASISGNVVTKKTLRLYQGDMGRVTFTPGLEANAVTIAEKLLDPTANPEIVDWLENNGGRTFKDLI